ncbi:putative NAD(P)-binding protein [Novosphingobium kunmingense]|uniref:Putative NAD(P)-binding protein n=1 Tax=Novosphingobium kunmingense TaxID=1211806 RepID=A0A2N0I1J2_9SPHN|nr:NAD(P)H-binding protein [Novosphingobium kunmingense]PKB25034.1 putative NAD(P)-binding protein [Novosphingobium kunmingense]
MSKPVRIALVGATGLIGQALIRAAVGRSDVRLIAIARREVPLPTGARMEVLVAETDGWADAIAAANADAVICALGTTIRRVGGDREAFRAVDHDLVLAVARAAKAANVRQLIVVSSVGASLATGNFYLRTKGEVEQALTKLGLTRLDLLRPGLLRGQRGERRPAERLAMLAAPLADLVLHGGYRKYRSIRDAVVAKALIGLAREKPAGRFVHEYDAILRAARKAGD